MSLIEVIQHYEENAKEFCQEELNQDFRCKNGAPIKDNGRGILKHASNVYTLTMFKRFEEELMDSIGLNCVKEANYENHVLYHLTKDGHERVYYVNFSHSNDSISCSCNMFKTLGLLCHHALCVLVINNVKEIPEPYILKRWTKSAKSMLVSNSTVGLVNEEKSTRLLRLSELNHIGYNLFDKSSLTRKCTKIVTDKLMEALQLVEKKMTTLKNVEQFENPAQKAIQEVTNYANEEVPCSIHEKPIFDPKFHPNWGAILEPNMSFTRMLDENSSSPFVSQDYLSSDVGTQQK
ncbi:protein FAR1-RELATED SEQUENCE 1-like [Dioscorea cayenensis subsp. rotundata]|uniref:Protein FAR1-RELATED SEQUENCE n=1 Tax=Dioscorea cayennensis subsp. rotundata TaxID=55577 RepID=A0AB40AMB0_DIOCR|nr:protein FAR1-RELATED SEQUENCE 1-like [Dioscorea cayenensis subsp. rotundata]